MEADLKRAIAGLLALLLGVNALAQLFASLWWYGAVPGVTETGPFNPHFVQDIGAAYLVTALGLAWFAWKGGPAWPALVAASAFLVLHAAIHLVAAAHHHGRHDLMRDRPGVCLPALLRLWLAAPPRRNGREA